MYGVKLEDKRKISCVSNVRNTTVIVLVKTKETEAAMISFTKIICHIKFDVAKERYLNSHFRVLYFSQFSVDSMDSIKLSQRCLARFPEIKYLRFNI